MEFEAKLQGWDEFNEILNAMPERVENRVLQGAVNGGARVGLQAVKKAAPVGPDRNPDRKSRTLKAAKAWARMVSYGHLKKNIKVFISKIDKQVGKRGAFISTNKGFWGNFLEKGTRHEAAKPWFLPAIVSVRDAIFDEIGLRLGKGIIKQCVKNGAPADSENT